MPSPAFLTLKRTNKWIIGHTAFGSIVTERNQSFGNGYKYGMNTQESEPELGSGMYSAEFWMYDGKLGRRWNVDPKPNVSFSSFSCFMNSPISFSDRFGDTTRYMDGNGALIFVANDKLKNAIVFVNSESWSRILKKWKESGFGSVRGLKNFKGKSADEVQKSDFFNSVIRDFLIKNKHATVYIADDLLKFHKDYREKTENKTPTINGKEINKIVYSPTINGTYSKIKVFNEYKSYLVTNLDGTIGVSKTAPEMGNGENINSSSIQPPNSFGTIHTHTFKAGFYRYYFKDGSKYPDILGDDKEQIQIDRDNAPAIWQTNARNIAISWESIFFISRSGKAIQLNIKKLWE